MKPWPKWVRRIRTVMNWYILLFVGSLVMALSEIKQLQEVKRVLIEHPRGVGMIIGGILSYVFILIVVQTARWSARSGRNWEYWIIATSNVAAAFVAPLMYMLRIHGAETDETKWAVGFLWVAMTFLIANLVALMYTFNRDYQEGKSFFFR